jgi:O-antigen ligase
MSEIDRPQRPPKNIELLTVVLAFYLAAPLYSIPIVNVSLSLPIIVILLLHLQRSTGRLPLPTRSPMAALFGILLCAMVLSLAANVFGGGLINDVASSVTYIFQFAFYMVCAGLAYWLFKQPLYPTRAARAFAWGVAIMSVFIVAEQLLLGGLRATGWSQLTRMSQNGYAVQFSSYLPFVFCAVVASRSVFSRVLWFAIGSFCLFAVVVNGSRTAWGTTVLTLGLFIVLYSVVLRRYRAALLTIIIAPLILAASWVIIPDRLKASLEQDFGTFENLEADKSWMIRQLQIQKSLKLFDENPLLGVGPGQFRNQAVPLEMPDVLAGRNATQFSDVSAHNSYIQFLAEGGLFFMVPYVTFLLWMLLAGLRSAIFLCGLGHVWALGLFCGFVGLSVHFWTISGLTSTGPWFIYGGMASMIYRAKAARRQAAPHVTAASAALTAR